MHSRDCEIKSKRPTRGLIPNWFNVTIEMALLCIVSVTGFVACEQIGEDVVFLFVARVSLQWDPVLYFPILFIQGLQAMHTSSIEFVKDLRFAGPPVSPFLFGAAALLPNFASELLLGRGKPVELESAVTNYILIHLRGGVHRYLWSRFTNQFHNLGQDHNRDEPEGSCTCYLSSTGSFLRLPL